MISSLANPQIKHLIQLQKKSRDRKEEGVFICEGRKMFEEARDFKDGRVVKAYVSESFFDTINEDFFQGTPFEIVSDSVFRETAETITPQGILAIVKQPVYNQKDMITADKVRILLLEDIRDPGNLGTMMRTAEGAGFTGVILSKGSVDLFNPKVIRSTMGAIYRVPFFYAEDFVSTLTEMRKAGIGIYAAHLNGACDYDNVSYGEKTAIMIGNEANGLSEESAENSTQCIKIPMEGSVESLNAGVAAAVLMYEVYRQLRMKK